jgi:hypothetical protein
VVVVVVVVVVVAVVVVHGVVVDVVGILLGTCRGPENPFNKTFIQFYTQFESITTVKPRKTLHVTKLSEFHLKLHVRLHEIECVFAFFGMSYLKETNHVRLSETNVFIEIFESFSFNPYAYSLKVTHF